MLSQGFLYFVTGNARGSQRIGRHASIRYPYLNHKLSEHLFATPPKSLTALLQNTCNTVCPARASDIKMHAKPQWSDIEPLRVLITLAVMLAIALTVGFMGTATAFGISEFSNTNAVNSATATTYVAGDPLERFA